MAKVTKPLFANAATGSIAGVGSFRKGKHGYQFMTTSAPTKDPTAAQLKMRACFSVARSAWCQLPEQSRSTWPVYWRAYILAHPECKS